MIRCWLLILGALLCSNPAGAAELTQRDWMVQLIDSLGWTFGLPDDPQDEDYIRLLSGERSLRLEAEEVSGQSERIAVKRITNYGAYSGTGWVSGLRKTTQIELPFLVLHSGTYQLAAATRLANVRLQIAGKEYLLGGQQQFARHELGRIDLPAGQGVLIVELPSQSGLDYIELLADPRNAIRPIDGWQPERVLSAEVLALTTLQALDLLQFLPETNSRQKVEVETVVREAGLQKVRDRHLGAPSAGAWLRAGNQAVSFAMPLRMSQPGCYRLALRGSSDQPVQVAVPGLFSAELDFGKSLTRKMLPPVCLSDPQLSLQIRLPAWAGLDLVEASRLNNDQQQLLSLIGFVEDQGQVDTETVNDLVRLLSRLH